MELIRGLNNLKPRHRGVAASIGNYDGVHRGHQAVLRDLKRRAVVLGVPATVIVFEPTPQEFFASAAPPARLMRFGEKLQALAEQGVERVVCLRFDRRLAELSPEDFITRILVRGLGVRHLVVGDDFRFGHARRGDFALLQRTGKTQGFEVQDTGALLADGERISSTLIREALAAGDMARAANMLGRPFALGGRVLYGAQLGRKLGFPTANIALNRRVVPVRGIFAARIHGIEPGPRDGIAYVGNRPAVGGAGPLLEAFVFDFDGDLYGRRLNVELLHRLRDDQHFANLEALQAQMQQDLSAARVWLKQYTAD
ncbi:MAG TPA: bifunctional riboflavin kinase/FAD synthetase [Gammaproteobacteria bacterium]|nr:bifunctional riboflavin kinase/FAD synthetase [Gammaproteobacteria bacterium]